MIFHALKVMRISIKSFLNCKLFLNEVIKVGNESNYKLDDYTFSYEKTTLNDESCIQINGCIVYNKCSNLIIPDEIDGLPVKIIGRKAFCSNGYSDLIESKSIKLPKYLEVIDDGAFFKSSIEKISFPETLRIIGNNTFSNSHLSSVQFNEGLEEIGSGAFSFTHLDEAILPDSLTEIAPDLFSHSGLSRIHLGANVKIIHESAFYVCSSLKDINLPEGLTHIADYAFFGTDIEDVILPDSLIALGCQVFEECESLETIHIGAKLTDVDVYDEFAYGCYNLKEITVSENNKEFKSIGGVLYNTDQKVLVRVPPLINADKIDIPRWVEKMAYFCFEDVDNITVVIRNPSIEYLDDSLLNDKKNIIACTKGSEVEKWAQQHNLKVSSIQSDLEIFLEDLIDDEKNPNK